MATYKNLFIDQGSSFSFEVKLDNTTSDITDLTNYSARGQIRKSYTSSSSVSFDITIDIENNKLIASLTAEQTSLLGMPQRVYATGRYVYDIEVFTSDSPSVVTRVIEGQVDITPRVTIV